MKRYTNSRRWPVFSTTTNKSSTITGYKDNFSKTKINLKKIHYLDRYLLQVGTEIAIVYDSGD